MQPDPGNLLTRLDLTTALIGTYDTPDTAPFEPVIAPKQGTRACVFAFYRRWLKGETLHVTADNPGCGGAGYWMCGRQSRSRPDFVRFLADEEGLKASQELIGRWLDERKPYRPDHGNLMIGPLKADQYDLLKTVTFLVNPDQLSALIIGAHYHAVSEDPPRVLAPFGSGCSGLLAQFEDFDVAQATIGAMDLAMRRYLPPDMLAFTVTKPMFEELCGLHANSFLYKPFWLDLRRARGLPDL